MRLFFKSASHCIQFASKPSLSLKCVPQYRLYSLWVYPKFVTPTYMKTLRPRCLLRKWAPNLDNFLSGKKCGSSKDIFAEKITQCNKKISQCKKKISQSKKKISQCKKKIIQCKKSDKIGGHDGRYKVPALMQNSFRFVQFRFEAKLFFFIETGQPPYRHDILPIQTIAHQLQVLSFND